MSDLKRMAGGDPIATRKDAEAVEQEYINNCDIDPLAMLRAETLLVCGYDPHHKGEITLHSSPGLSREHEMMIEATLGRCLLRYLNQRARAN